MVRTSPFHGGNRGSNPRGVTMVDIIVVSDIHIFSRISKPIEFKNFLRTVATKANTLVINGDLFDRLPSKISKKELDVIKELNLIKEKIKIVYIKGNHDADLDSASFFPGVETYSEYTAYSGHKKITFLHGDKLEKFIHRHPKILKTADIFIRLLFFSKLHALAKFFKNYFINLMRHQYRDAVMGYARSKRSDIICVGHIHYEEIFEQDQLIYANTGSWLEESFPFIAINNQVVTLNFFIG
jgi:UDP-2,3-diacylglucosamine pyrophosphatase LpxH